MTATTYVGYAAGALTVLSLVPQVVRVYRTRAVDEISWGWVTLLVTSGALWITYGVLSSQRPVILTNVGVVVLAGAILVAKVRFGGRPPAETPRAVVSGAEPLTLDRGSIP